MKIVFDIKEKESKNAEIGDIVVTEKGGYYLILDSTEINNEYYKAICNLQKNKIEFLTMQGSMYVDCYLYGEKISQIIDKDDYKLIIDEHK